ncbi:MAG: YihY/virulence factor BrkB family protein [Propionibacteriaceae bacterium]
MDDRAASFASMLSYYGFASFVPLLLVFVSILGFLSFGRLTVDSATLAALVGTIPLVGDDLVSPRFRGSLPALLLGAAVTLWSAIGITQQAQLAFNTVYNLPRKDWLTYGSRTLRSVIAVLVGGPGFIAAIVVSVAVVGTERDVLSFPIALRIVGGVLLIVVNTTMHTLFFRLLTAEHPRWRTTWRGALFAGVGWSVVQVLAAWLSAYKLNEAAAPYRTFAAVLGLLALFHVLGMVTLWGAEMNYVRARVLWPRGLFSIIRVPTTPADQRSYRGYLQRGLFASGGHEQVEVAFSNDPAGAPDTVDGRDDPTSTVEQPEPESESEIPRP